MTTPIITGSDWTTEMLQRLHDECAIIADEELGLDTYPNDFQIISSEQMLDAYASIGLPVWYRHWSFGKSYMSSEQSYRSGRSGLAYELVINSNPCINYLMEENTPVTQALVIAHAGFGHNHFFKNNYLFKDWTDAEGIIDYLTFARDYIHGCEERHGEETVEAFLDSVHALQSHGVDKYKRPRVLNHREEIAREEWRAEEIQREVNILWDVVVPAKKVKKNEIFPPEPEENILKFIEKNAPTLETWQRELIRIVRMVQQYFYPQSQTKVMNEGFACWTHNFIINRLYDKDLLSEGAMLEFIQLNTNVIFQPSRSHFNPYALGINMFKDIERICTNPTDEDREWFPDLIGVHFIDAIKDAVENYRDESFIRQFLSPHLIRDMRMFNVVDADGKDAELFYKVKHIHNTEGYKAIRKSLADSYTYSRQVPDIQIVNANIKGNRHLELDHHELSGKELHENDTIKVLIHLKKLWGFDVSVRCFNGVGENIKTFTTEKV